MEISKYTQQFILYIIFLIAVLSISGYYSYNLHKQNQIRKDEAVNAIFEEVMKQCESSYFEGQKDAINGNWRIKRTINKQDTCYMWTKSCWDNSTRKIQYMPPCSKK